MDTVEFVKEMDDFDVSAVDVSVNRYHVNQTVVVKDPLAVPATDFELEQIAHDGTVAQSSSSTEYIFYDVEVKSEVPIGVALVITALCCCKLKYCCKSSHEGFSPI